MKTKTYLNNYRVTVIIPGFEESGNTYEIPANNIPGVFYNLVNILEDNESNLVCDLYEYKDNVDTMTKEEKINTIYTGKSGLYINKSYFKIEKM
ncbi:MAG: hypothetical protein ACM3O3_13005 [Syntrophothermus sp.]